MAAKGTTRKLHETDSECEENTTTVKTVQKKKKYLQKFKSTYTRDFPCVISSSKGEECAFCTTCSLHFKIGHGGQNDVKRHVQSEMHKASGIKINLEIIGDFLVC